MSPSNRDRAKGSDNTLPNDIAPARSGPAKISRPSRCALSVRRIGRATGSTEAVLDAMIVGEPRQLERRMTLKPMTFRRAAESAPVELLAFDLVWLDGHPRWDAPWDERRADLEALELKGPAWGTSVVHRGDGPALVAAASGNGQVEGLIGKRRDSPYRPGETSDDWLDIDLT